MDKLLAAKNEYFRITQIVIGFDKVLGICNISHLTDANSNIGASQQSIQK